MSMTDPIADMLTRIRNGNQARKERVDVPWSRTKESLARVLVDEGFSAVTRRSPAEARRNGLRVVLHYDEQRRPVITGLKRVSRPSLRVYVGAEEIPPIRSGLGVNILSTPTGILVDREARKRGVGGELLCSVW